MRHDYHGSRSYEMDEPPIGRTSLALAWILSGAKRRFKSFMLWAAPPSSSTTLLDHGERHFSKLGARPAPKRPRRGDQCPFPTKAPRAENDWRVLP